MSENKAKVYIDSNGEKLYGFANPVVYNETIKIPGFKLVVNKDVDPLTKDLCFPRAIDIALKSLEKD